MKHQPLWIDVSKWQGNLDWDKIAAKEGDDKVHGVFTRAGGGWYEGGEFYTDPTFATNWNAIGQRDMYRSSYFPLYPANDLQGQIGKWYEINPEIDFIPRMIDMEVGGVEPEEIADTMWDMSEAVLSRDGVRPIIYSRVGLIEKWLAPFWTPEMLNAHYYLLAQYDLNDKEDPSTWGEYNSIVVPTHNGEWAVDPKNILWKQTCPYMPIYQASGSVDRDRWIWTDAETMHEQLQEMFGHVEVDLEKMLKKAIAATILNSVKIETCQQGQLELAEDIMALEDRVKVLEERPWYKFRWF